MPQRHKFHGGAGLAYYYLKLFHFRKTSFLFIAFPRPLFDCCLNTAIRSEFLKHVQFIEKSVYYFLYLRWITKNAPIQRHFFFVKVNTTLINQQVVLVLVLVSLPTEYKPCYTVFLSTYLIQTVQNDIQSDPTPRGSSLLLTAQRHARHSADLQ